MSVLGEINKEKVVYSKGALEYLIKKCTFIQKTKTISKLSETEKKKILEEIYKLAPKKLKDMPDDLEDKLTYNITGTENQNLLGLFSVDIFKIFNVDATDGEIVSQDQSIYNKIAFFFLRF